LNLSIQVLSVSVTTKQGKKAYQNAEVAFKDLTQGKVSSKNITQYSDVFKVFSEASPGQQYTVVSEKKGDFWEWTSATRVLEGSTPPQTQTSAPVQESKYQASPKSTYETPEERAKKQVYIVRQSSISSALEFLKHNYPKTTFTQDQVLTVAENFTDFVFGKTDLFKQPNDLPSDELGDIPL
jgi:hypothetical protein